MKILFFRQNSKGKNFMQFQWYACKNFIDANTKHTKKKYYINNFILINIEILQLKNKKVDDFSKNFVKIV